MVTATVEQFTDGAMLLACQVEGVTYDLVFSNGAMGGDLLSTQTDIVETLAAALEHYNACGAVRE